VVSSSKLEKLKPLNHTKKHEKTSLTHYLIFGCHSLVHIFAENNLPQRSKEIQVVFEQHNFG